VFDALGLEGVQLPLGGMTVVHHRKGKILASEQHLRP